MIYYEKMSLFEALFEKEKDYGKVKNSDIIQNSFTYAILINNFTVALYLLQKYRAAFTERVDMVIDSILHIINEYNECNGGDKYKHGILHFEELLYFLDTFIYEFNLTQSHYFMNITLNLIELKSLEDEE